MEEQEKNELSDILIKNADRQKSSNLKNMLLIAAITLLIFFIGILVFKMVSSSDEEKITKQEKNLPLPKEDKKEELFEPVAVEAVAEEAAKEDLDEMIKRIKEAKANKQNSKYQPLPVKEMPKKETKEPNTQQKQVEQQTEQQTEQKFAPPKEEIAIKQPPKHVKKVKKYYIQVASLSKYKPNKRFLATITNNGYKYKIVTKKVNSIVVKRVYVGPFDSRKSANKALPDIMDKISEGAFIVKDY
jgi:DedD protein